MFTSCDRVNEFIDLDQETVLGEEPPLQTNCTAVPDDNYNNNNNINRYNNNNNNKQDQ